MPRCIIANPYDAMFVELCRLNVVSTWRGMVTGVVLAPECLTGWLVKTKNFSRSVACFGF